MIANKYKVKKYCEDYTKIENYDEALSSPLRYDLHHRHEISENKSASDLIDENLYYHRPPEELIFLEHGEHMRLHNLNSSEETRQKISEALKGEKSYMYGKPSHWKGKHPSEETRKKMSDAKKGKPCPWRGKHWHTENGHRVWTE